MSLSHRLWALSLSALSLWAGCGTGGNGAERSSDTGDPKDSDSGTDAVGETEVDTDTVAGTGFGDSSDTGRDIDSDTMPEVDSDTERDSEKEVGTETIMDTGSGLSGDKDTESVIDTDSGPPDTEASHNSCEAIVVPDDAVVVAPVGGDFESVGAALDSGAAFIHVTSGSDAAATFDGFVLGGEGQTVACAAGVTIHGSVRLDGSNNVLWGCTVTMSEDDPVIRVRGSNNRAECNDLSLSMQGDGIWFSDGSDNIIVGNYLHDLLRSDVSGDPHADCFQTWGNATGILFEGNTCDHNRADGSNQIAMIEAKTGDVTHLTFRKNIFVMHDEWYSPLNAGDKIVDDTFTVHDIAIENNVFENRTGDGESAVSTWGGAWNVSVQRNVIIGYGSSTRDYVQVDELESNVIGDNIVWKANGDWPMTQFGGDIFADPQTADPASIGFETVFDAYNVVEIGEFER